MLGTGTLHRIRDGLLEGTATFPIRGEFPVMLDCPGKDRDQNTARLTVGPHRGRVSEFRGNPMADEPARFWHGYMTVDGYQMRVRLIPGPTWTVEFHDCKQRDPQRWQVTA